MFVFKFFVTEVIRYEKEQKDPSSFLRRNIVTTYRAELSLHHPTS